MRAAVIAICLTAFAGAAAAQAQTPPSAPPAGGPYLLLLNTTEQLFLISVGSRVASGTSATITLVALTNPPGNSPRIDMALEYDCPRRASRSGAMAVRDLKGGLLQTTMATKRDWIVAGTGEQDQKMLTFACQGTYTGPTSPNIDQIGRVWREQVAGTK